MPRYHTRTFAAILLLAICIFAGCSGPARADTSPTPIPTLAPTLTPTIIPTVVPTSTPTIAPTPSVSSPTPTLEAKECGAGPCLAVTATPVRPTAVGLDPAFAALVDPEPGPTTLTYGSDVQNGAPGYAVWCTASGQMAIYDTFGRVSIPTAALVVPQGSVVTFAYLGADPLRQILARIYSAVPIGTPLPPGQFTIPADTTGMDVPVVQTDRKGAITLAVPPGEYALFVNARLQAGPKAEACGAQYQFRIRVT